MNDSINSNTKDTTYKLNHIVDHIVDEPITCLAAHPELPYIIAGSKSGSIAVYGSDIVNSSSNSNDDSN